MVSPGAVQGFIAHASDLILEKPIESQNSAQALDSSSYMKKVLITNKVITHFFITLSKSISRTSFLCSTDFSRIIPIVYE